MTKNIDISASLQRLLEQDSTLISSLKTVQDMDQARDLILHSAQQQGVELDAGALERELAPVAQLVSSLTTLDQVMAADPSLEAAVRETEHVEEAIDLIMASAQRQGVTLDADELVKQMRTMTDQVTFGELSDEALVDVSGGSLVMAAGIIIGGAIIGGAMVGVIGGGYGLGVMLARMPPIRR